MTRSAGPRSIRPPLDRLSPLLGLLRRSSGEAEPPGARERSRMRRRLRRQRQMRDALLLDLGALVFELHRHGRREPELLQAKAAELTAVDQEVRALADALGADQGVMELVAPGIAGTCDQCGALMSVDARYCASCGAPAVPALSADGEQAPVAAPIEDTSTDEQAALETGPEAPAEAAQAEGLAGAEAAVEDLLGEQPPAEGAETEAATEEAEPAPTEAAEPASLPSDLPPWGAPAHRPEPEAHAPEDPESGAQQEPPRTITDDMLDRAGQALRSRLGRRGGWFRGGRKGD